MGRGYVADDVNTNLIVMAGAGIIGVLSEEATERDAQDHKFYCYLYLYYDLSIENIALVFWNTPI